MGERWRINTAASCSSNGTSLKHALHHLPQLPGGIKPQLSSAVTCFVKGKYWLLPFPFSRLHSPGGASWGHDSSKPELTSLSLGEPNLKYLGSLSILNSQGKSCRVQSHCSSQPVACEKGAPWSCAVQSPWTVAATLSSVFLTTNPC